MSYCNNKTNESNYKRYESNRYNEKNIIEILLQIQAQLQKMEQNQKQIQGQLQAMAQVQGQLQGQLQAMAQVQGQIQGQLQGQDTDSTNTDTTTNGNTISLNINLNGEPVNGTGYLDIESNI